MSLFLLPQENTNDGIGENDDKVTEESRKGEQEILGRREEADRLGSRGGKDCVGTKIPSKQRAKLEGEQPKKMVKKRKYALVGSSWGIEEGAPDLGLDLREYDPEKTGV